MVTAYLALGSNLGDRYRYIFNALTAIKALSKTHLRAVSTLIESKPQGGPPQPDFINGVVAIETEQSPRELLLNTQCIEKCLGRKRQILNGPRTIDIDILLYGDHIVNYPDLIIPHPRMWERSFVTRPLLEIAPWLSHGPLKRMTKISRGRRGGGI